MIHTFMIRFTHSKLNNILNSMFPNLTFSGSVKILTFALIVIILQIPYCSPTSASTSSDKIE